jgi:hypothetical protein
MVFEVQGSTTATNNGEYIIRHVDSTLAFTCENEDGSTAAFAFDC